MNLKSFERVEGIVGGAGERVSRSGKYRGKRRGRKPRYPWKAWFSQEHTLLVKGVDYHTSQGTIAQNIRNEATKLRLLVSIADLGDKISLRVKGKAPDRPIPSLLDYCT